MPRPSSSENSLRSLVDDFVGRLVAAVEADVSNRARQTVLAALGGEALPKRRGRPPKFASLVTTVSAPVRRRAKQLCPVPGCSNPAAPVFGMVCSKHKDVPRALIKKYRESRRAEKDNKPKRGPGRPPGSKSKTK